MRYRCLSDLEAFTLMHREPELHLYQSQDIDTSRANSFTPLRNSQGIRNYRECSQISPLIPQYRRPPPPRTNTYVPGMFLDSFNCQGLGAEGGFDEHQEPLIYQSSGGIFLSETPVQCESSQVLSILQQQQGILIPIITKQNNIYKNTDGIRIKTGRRN